MSVLVQARIDPKIKEEASAVLEDMGLSVSDAVRLMLVKTAKEKTLPFKIWHPNGRNLAKKKGVSVHDERHDENDNGFGNQSL